MIRTVRRFSAVVIALALVGGAAIYAMQKPYQQDRILLSLGLKAG